MDILFDAVCLIINEQSHQTPQTHSFADHEEEQRNINSQSQSIETDQESQHTQDGTASRRKACHKCGNIRKKMQNCMKLDCPHIFCLNCVKKINALFASQNQFLDGCPVCCGLCCCANRTLECAKPYHCYRKCPVSRACHVRSVPAKKRPLPADEKSCEMDMEQPEAKKKGESTTTEMVSLVSQAATYLWVLTAVACDNRRRHKWQCEVMVVSRIDCVKQCVVSSFDVSLWNNTLLLLCLSLANANKVTINITLQSNKTLRQYHFNTLSSRSLRQTTAQLASGWFFVLLCQHRTTTATTRTNIPPQD